MMAPPPASRRTHAAQFLLLLLGFSLAAPSEAGVTLVDHVIAISVDGLRPDAVTALGPAEAPNFYRLRNEGAFTDNARTDYDYSVTLPNHTSMLTGRRVTTAAGHNWTDNGEPAPSATLHNNKGSYVASAFDVAHDNGLRTALYAGKSKFVLYPRSYDATNGGLDTTGSDDGRNKIDVSLINSDSAALTTSFITGMESAPYNFSMLHLRDTDDAGHSSTWNITNPNSTYMNAVRAVDDYLGTLLESIETHPALAGRTMLILTADHGGIQGTTSHSDASNSQAYTVPFYVWGPGVPGGADLYAMNPTTRQNPGSSRPTYSASVQPIRSGDIANLALSVLGLGAVPDSTINVTQNLNVLSPFPPGDFNYDYDVTSADYAVWRQQYGATGNYAADANGDGAVDAVDYVLWRHYLNSNGSGASAISPTAQVPEPPAGIVAAFVVCGWGASRVRPARLGVGAARRIDARQPGFLGPKVASWIR